jgi:DNA topoisomerase-2
MSDKNTKSQNKPQTTKLDALKYDKKTPREHVLIRPDTYVGDIEPTTESMWVTKGDKIIKEIITYTPGFLKVFDELIVNARDASVNDESCDTIKVEYNVEEGYISVWNNGDKGIPVEEHPEHKMLVPTMIFGELLTSSNYNDDEERTTGGRNGYGSKLCNIFSTKFEVEVMDAKRHKKFHQVWRDNMSIAEKAKVTENKNGKSYVKVTFYPDFARFKVKDLNNDHKELFERRAIDIAGVTNGKLKVYFNDKKIESNTFKQYVELYYKEDEIFYDLNDRWSVGCLYKQDCGGDVISFANGISTYRGGTHCNHVIDNIIKTIINDYIKKKDKDIKVTPSLLKENLIFFITATIVNPAFSSQTKDTLTSKTEKFGSKYEPTPAFMKKLAKCGIVEQIIQLVKFKENSNLKKTDGKKQVKITGIPKLDDANKAGTKESSKCTLILTEGDSAKAFAMAGLGLIGRDYFGVFPL